MYREWVAGLVEEIEADAAAERKRTGREPLGAERQEPLSEAMSQAAKRSSDALPRPEIADFTDLAGLRRRSFL